LLEQFNLCRFIYNQLLEELSRNKNRGYIQHHIVVLKGQYPQLKKVYSKTLQYECYRLFANIKGLAISKKNGNKIGKLRFKGKEWFKTICYNQKGFKIIPTGKRFNKVHFSKIGDINFIQHRPIGGNIKGIIIKKKVASWEIHVISDSEYKLEKGEGRIGIDLGIYSFLTDNYNNKVSNPLYLKKSLNEVKLLHRQLSHKKKGSNNRYKCKNILARKYEKITDQRTDFIHKLTTKMINENCYIAIEKLNIQKLQSLSWNAQNIADSAWYRFISMLKFKAESAGTTVIEVNPAYTTMQCNKCKNIQKIELENRTYNCSKCGIIIDRDYNAAKNIYDKSLERGIVEIDEISSSMKQEAIFSTTMAVRV
jgi:putative transposase